MGGENQKQRQEKQRQEKQRLERQRLERQRKIREECKRRTGCCCSILFVAGLFVFFVLLQTKPSMQPFSSMINSTDAETPQTDTPPQALLDNPTCQPNKETKMEAKEEVAVHTESTEIVELQYELPYESSTGEIVLLKNKFKGTMKEFKITYQKQMDAYASK